MKLPLVLGLVASATTILLFAGCVHALRNGQPQQQQNRPPGLYRSQSNPELNRLGNNPAGYPLQRQSSFRDSCRTDYRFDLLTLALMWPPGSCSSSRQKCRRTENTHFTVHGMWPTINGTHEPSRCCFDNVFDPSVLDPIRDVLNNYWYSYYTVSDNNKFWAHEWITHGTCARNVPSLKGEVKYFGTTVQLAQKLDIIQHLAKANIVPDDSKLYDAKDIVAALQETTQGRVFQIQCDGDQNLTGLQLCYDKDLNPVNCKPSQRRCQHQLRLRKSIDESRRPMLQSWRSMYSFA